MTYDLAEDIVTPVTDARFTHTRFVVDITLPEELLTGLPLDLVFIMTQTVSVTYNPYMDLWLLTSISGPWHRCTDSKMYD